jgi:hypothetical protein
MYRGKVNNNNFPKNKSEYFRVENTKYHKIKSLDNIWVYKTIGRNTTPPNIGDIIIIRGVTYSVLLIERDYRNSSHVVKTSVNCGYLTLERIDD